MSNQAKNPEAGGGRLLAYLADIKDRDHFQIRKAVDGSKTGNRKLYGNIEEMGQPGGAFHDNDKLKGSEAR